MGPRFNIKHIVVHNWFRIVRATSPKRGFQTVHHILYVLVDEALWSFLKIRQALTSDPKIQEVAGNPKLQKKLPGYTVRMGYGMHLGWGIEGAIGSSHKVDASYLSPHVNMSARLEAASNRMLL